MRRLEVGCREETLCTQKYIEIEMSGPEAGGAGAIRQTCLAKGKLSAQATRRKAPVGQRLASGHGSRDGNVYPNLSL